MSCTIKVLETMPKPLIYSLFLFISVLLFSVKTEAKGTRNSYLNLIKLLPSSPNVITCQHLDLHSVLVTRIK